MIYNLKEVLSTLPLPPKYDATGVSTKWKCRIVPMIKEGDHEDEQLLAAFLESTPVKLAESRAEDAHKRCGHDALRFVCDTKWNTFSRPKIAFKAGWAGPGTEMEEDRFHALITAFDQVFNGTKRVPVSLDSSDVSTAGVEDVLNLQMFHRPEDSLPVLGELLLWPNVLCDSEICDNATRLSQRGATTWWHLDDSGECVMQAALPLSGEHSLFGGIDAKNFPGLLTGRVPAKLFLYGPRDSYDWFMADDETEVSGKITSLDIFHTPDEFLPEAEYLPVIVVAVLEAGAHPLVSPPNIPHVVVTMNDCVMVEQRRVSNLFLCEVAFFLNKVRHWSNSPIVYPYLQDHLQSEPFVRSRVVPSLLETFQTNDGCTRVDHLLLVCVVRSLYSISQFPDHFALAADSRKTLQHTLQGERFLVLLPQADRERLTKYWDVRRKWVKPGCVLKFDDERDAFTTVIYLDNKSVFGPVRKSLVHCRADYHMMEAALKVSHDSLCHTLSSLKKKDELLLSDLF